VSAWQLSWWFFLIEEEMTVVREGLAVNKVVVTENIELAKEAAQRPFCPSTSIT